MRFTLFVLLTFAALFSGCKCPYAESVVDKDDQMQAVARSGEENEPPQALWDSISNADVTWTKTCVGMLPALSESAKRVLDFPNSAILGKLMEALNDENKYVVAHFLLCHCTSDTIWRKAVNEEEDMLDMEGLIVKFSLVEGGLVSVETDPRQREKLREIWANRMPVPKSNEIEQEDALDKVDVNLVRNPGCVYSFTLKNNSTADIWFWKDESSMSPPYAVCEYYHDGIWYDAAIREYPRARLVPVLLKAGQETVDAAAYHQVNMQKFDSDSRIRISVAAVDVSDANWRENKSVLYLDSSELVHTFGTAEEVVVRKVIEPVQVEKGMPDSTISISAFGHIRSNDWEKHYPAFSQQFVRKAKEQGLNADALEKTLEKIRQVAYDSKLAYLPIEAVEAVIDGESAWIVTLKWDYDKLEFDTFLMHWRYYAISQKNQEVLDFQTCM